MAKLPLLQKASSSPNLKTSTNTALAAPSGLGINSGASAVLPAAQIGNTASGLGMSMVNEGTQLIDKASASIAEAVAQKATADAVTDLNQKVQDRINKPFDENGNPTFDKLSTDIDSIVNDVRNTHGNNLLSPESRAQFNKSMTELQTRYTLQAQQVSRQQQESYVRGQLINTTDKLSNTALTDTVQNLPFYVDQIQKSIDAQVANGALSYEEGQKMKLHVGQEIPKAKFALMAQDDPETVQKMLATPSAAAKFGVSNEIDRIKILDGADAAIRDREYRKEQEAKAQQKLIHDQQIKTDNDLNLAILQGKAGESEVDAAYTQGTITQKQHLERIKQVMSARGDNAASMAKMLEINQARIDGKVLSDYSSADIDKSFDSYTAGLKDKNGQPASLYQLAAAASTYKAPVNSFNNRIKNTIWSAKNPQEMIDAAQAYDFLNQQNPIAASSLDQETRDAIGVILTKAKYASTDPNQILQDVKNLKKLTTDDRGVLAPRAMKEIDDKYEPQKLVAEVFQSSPWFGRNAAIGNDMQGLTRQAVIDAYVRNGGDLAAAIKSTGLQMSGSVGVSEVGGSKRVMAFPPERFIIDKSTGQPLPIEEINSLLNKDIEAVKIDNPSIPSHTVKGLTGTVVNQDIKNIQVRADARTRQNLEQPDYAVYYTGSDGQEHLLTDKNFQPVRFTVTQDEINSLKQEKINAAEKINNRAKEETTGGVILKDGRLNPKAKFELMSGNDSWKNTAVSLLKHFEGFSSHAYWDVNALRSGYGSDTVTKADGTIERVHSGTRVSKADAERDLSRRVSEFYGVVENQVGTDTMNSLPDKAKAALVSVAYNYGSLRSNVVRAAQSGDLNALADSVESLKHHNRGINAKRRQQEADLIRSAGR